MDAFNDIDFEAIAQWFRDNDYFWSNGPWGRRVPTAGEIKAAAISLAKDCPHPGTSAASGRLYVKRLVDGFALQLIGERAIPVAKLSQAKTEQS